MNHHASVVAITWTIRAYCVVVVLWWVARQVGLPLRRGYFIFMAAGYAVGLLMANMAVYVMGMGQVGVAIVIDGAMGAVTFCCRCAMLCCAVERSAVASRLSFFESYGECELARP